METNITFAMIKPEIIAEKKIGEVITAIEKSGFIIQKMRMHQFNIDEAKAFYKIHHERPFYGELCQYIASGPVVGMVLAKENAVPAFRAIIGATNPLEAAPETIRKRFGKSIEANAIHGSDSNETAAEEIKSFFCN
jgi:nucleoside-diphosphate kinase